MRLFWVLSFAAIAAFATDRTLEASGSTAAAVSVNERTAPRLSSAIPAVRINPADQVPVAATREASEGYCRSLVGYERVPTTSLGREIVRRGWHVTSEVRVGGHVAVGYVRKLVAGTSAICYPVEGHVAIADRTHLIAIISNAREPREETLYQEAGVGEVHLVPGTHNLRISDDTGPTPPMAEVRIDADGIHVVPLASRDPICHGRAFVPNVYGQRLPAASRVLARFGWRPSRRSTEYQGCSPTGVGYCIFTYARGRRSIDVVTAWETRVVARFTPHC
ncbi:MAG: hypothetical protein JO276_05460 [Sphingomonadaceae bacterium]|nr:hypothetical protein [Sphingomonadaceae bacterium]